MLASAVDLNGPGRYLHWSIFTVSLSNLVLIAVMVVIFAAALFVPFPGHADAPPPPPAAPTGGTAEAGDRTWTGALRRWGLRLLPPGKLLPDRQPAYVASWIYVFGVASLVTLGLAVVSGFVIALGGTDWWHTSSVGHFANSLHLWSVELFMAFLVIHLWGKFWMAAWRGRRAMTWVTGILAFLASIVECFTGYLSQQNFDSQWISTNGKDAVNTVGLGGAFNLMNFGQMLLWHLVLVPIVLIALVAVHVLLVRIRGVSHPLPVRLQRGRRARRTAARADAAEWTGPTRVYDILKEATVAGVVATVLVVVLAAVLSSPDEPSITIRTWARLAPADFLATTASELDGTSETATYGPPYNNQSGSVQRIGVSWQRLGGVQERIHTASAFVLTPLRRLASTNPALTAALHRYEAAPRSQQLAWAEAYAKAVTHVHFVGAVPVVPAAADGPVPTLAAHELVLARSGALDTDLLANRSFYGTDFTKPLLFLEDGSYFAAQAQAQHLTGSQWGVMNETGSYPGQPWLWLYTLWYQVPGFDNSANVDLIAVYLTGAATLLLLAVPFIPGLRNVPEVVPLHRLIWRRWNARQEGGVPRGPAAPSPDGAGTPAGELTPSGRDGS